MTGGTRAGVTPAAAEASAGQGKRIFHRHEHLVGRQHAGQRDHLTAAEVLDFVTQMPPRVESASHGYPQIRPRGTTRLLAWLESYPGCGWQERWGNAGAAETGHHRRSRAATRSRCLRGACGTAQMEPEPTGTTSGRSSVESPVARMWRSLSALQPCTVTVPVRCHIEAGADSRSVHNVASSTSSPVIEPEQIADSARRTACMGRMEKRGQILVTEHYPARRGT